jgi:S1-C subfamily serine protease
MFTHNADPSTPADDSEAMPTPPRHRRLRFGTRTLIALALAGSMLGGGIAGSVVTTAVALPSAVSAAATTQVVPPASTAGAVFRKVGPAIVEVLVSGSTTRRGLTPSGSGSGVVLDTSGHILTNYHVVAQATSVRVRFSTGEERTAQVVGTDRGNDLALLKVDLPANTPAAPLGDSDQVQVGDPAIAIGSPFGLEETVTQGIISAVHRDWQPQGSTLQRNLIQTDAPINPGNSGGALLNANGEVIGITTAIESPVRGSVGVGFAVPINTAKQLLPQLESGAQLEPVWLGIGGQELTPEVAQAQGLTTQRGVLVEQVVDGSPAAQANLQVGDVITAVDGTTIATFAQLSAQLASHKVGDTIKLTVVRSGQERQLTAVLQARPAGTE